jgi:AraC family transcriptional regulator, regulatory protein of adaptative response / DNA-3-methyladenine glycosylase II
MTLDRDACYRAIQARDRRFDGRFYVGVRTTGIYCRPICPAPCPRLENVVFYSSAAAAHEAGLRPCLRCRPECSPQLAGAQGSSPSVSRALALIAEGALDRGEGSVEALAGRLGMGERQLRRLFEKHLGASPLAVAHTRRVLLAKQLLHETNLRMVDVAMAAGFGSLRRFNDTFRRMYGRPPSALRRDAECDTENGASGITLTLGYSGSYDWAAMHEFFAARAIAGIERAEPERYSRTIEVGESSGLLEVTHLAERSALRATIHCADVRALPAIIARVRNLFDLTSDTQAIGAQLATDPCLAPLVAARPGLRVPGAWDPFELAVRAVLGQQVSVAAARTLLGRLALAYGEPLASSAGPDLERLFPRAERLARADLATLGIPRARASTLSGLAAAVLENPDLLRGEGDLDAKVARLRALPGIGDWTAQYIALRALREPDAFPAADVGLLRALANGCERPSAAELLARAERWRPWRAYAAQYLWSATPARNGDDDVQHP